jgi:predicted phosphate transport protein (TIGR00153 family)
MLRKRLDFLSRGEKDILDEVISNLDLSLETARHLLKQVDFLKIHDYSNVLKEYEIISNLETEADSVHLKSVERICSGSFFGGIREDFLALLECIDSIADSAKGAARIFRAREVSVKAIDYFFKEDVVLFVETCIEAVEVFRSAVVALGESKSEVIKLAAQVERKEEEADAVKATVLENLLKNKVDAEVLDVIMLKDFIGIADNVADYAEDGSDVLLTLVAKGYS